MHKITIVLLTSLLISRSAFAQPVTNEELMTILKITAFRVPSFPKKQWTINLISDSVKPGKIVPIEKVLQSDTKALVAVQLLESSIGYSLIQHKELSSSGELKRNGSKSTITWNNVPEHLYGNTFIIASIMWEEETGDEKPFGEYLVIELIDELKL